MIQSWDYLLLTAGNARQADLYREQLSVRAKLGLLAGFDHWLVVEDPEGKRVGSGGSTLGCLLEVLNAAGPSSTASQWQETLGALRILIVHAGGDSRRLPAYGPCGKAFVPLPCDGVGALGSTLFDYQLPIYAALPAPPAGQGQIVITSGDVLLGFQPSEVDLSQPGITGVGCRAAPEQAARHGVYCVRNGGHIRRFLQKPTVDIQRESGALNKYGESVLDIGVISFDADTAVRLLELCEVSPNAHGRLAMLGDIHTAIMSHGLDFYREICCALGDETSPHDYLSTVRDSGSRWSESQLHRIHAAISPHPSRVCVLSKCEFLHFGSAREILTSGQYLARSHQPSIGHADPCLIINSEFTDETLRPHTEAWIEGCRVQQPLDLGSPCTLVGVDVEEPLSLPPRACLDILPGHGRDGNAVHFVRCYLDSDPLQSSSQGIQFCGLSLDKWLACAELTAEEIWSPELPIHARCLWNARLFPAEREHAGYRQWLWMFDALQASSEQFCHWARADRYSFEEMALSVDVRAFYARRTRMRADRIRSNLHCSFRSESQFSAADLAYLIGHSSSPAQWLKDGIAAVRWQAEHADRADPQQAFAFSRAVHSLGTVIHAHFQLDEPVTEKAFADGVASLLQDDQKWLAEFGLGITAKTSARQWADVAQQRAFDHLRGQIISSQDDRGLPRNSLRSDEIVWGRAPARLDLGGGWTDTPPYALERGGCVLNAAVELNGQPPIQAFARVISEPIIRLRSIDVGTQLELWQADQLLNCAVARGEFSLVQAALAISGFAPPAGMTLPQLLTAFGGGLEITTLAAIPKGSGLGTSSIMGAVLLAVVNRILGRQLSAAELFHGVLRLEQYLTTGGGWQDQIGGSAGGLKLITTRPGLVPDAVIRYLPSDVLDPGQNGGLTLLYYTGITRLAKNILQQVVGRYLDRDREAMRTLQALHEIAPRVADAVARKEIGEFGRLIDQVWMLNKRLDPDSSNDQIETMLARVRPWIYGAKLLGAGGGGFLLLVCRGRQEASFVREELDRDPPNPRARFFDFAVSGNGLTVSVC